MDRYIMCEVLLDNDKLEHIAWIGLHQIPSAGEQIWFGDSLSPGSLSSYTVRKVAYHVRPQLEQACVYQIACIFVEPIPREE